MTSLILPTNFAYVALVGAGAALLNLYQQSTVGAARKAAGIQYPQFYADKAQADASPAARRFNCAQRAHGNTLEAVPTFLFNLVYSGLYYPRAAASLGAIWLVGRFLFTRSYASGNPDLRNKQGGIIHYIGYLGLWLTTLYTAGTQVYTLLK